MVLWSTAHPQNFHPKNFISEEQDSEGTCAATFDTWEFMGKFRPCQLQLPRYILKVVAPSWSLITLFNSVCMAPIENFNTSYRDFLVKCHLKHCVIHLATKSAKIQRAGNTLKQNCKNVGFVTSLKFTYLKNYGMLAM